MKRKVEILMGLPGSGKTNYRKEQEKEKKGMVCAIDVDAIMKESFYGRKTLQDCVKEGLYDRLAPRHTTIIIDGLILTYEDIVNVVDIISHINSFDIELVIHYWKEDRETCLKNDGGRRELSSANTILNAQFDKIEKEVLNERLKEFDLEVSNIIYHNIVLKPDWERYARKHNVNQKDGFLYSEKWCSGGTSGNCWDEHLTEIMPEEPLEFDELDNLLEKVCPTITFLQYKKLRKECVDIEETDEHDYYSGTAHYQQWVCDLKKMYALLEEWGYIRE